LLVLLLGFVFFVWKFYDDLVKAAEMAESLHLFMQLRTSIIMIPAFSHDEEQCYCDDFLGAVLLVVKKQTTGVSH